MKEIKEYLTSEKIRILEANNWTCVEGFVFDFESPENAQNVVISYEEIFSKLREGAQWYCMCEYGDYFIDLESAWEELLDEVSCELDTDDLEEVHAYIEKKRIENEEKEKNK